MDILTPIGIGFLSNTIIFIISMLLIKDVKKSTNITFIFVVLFLLASLIISGWSGMGMGVIGIGMLLVTVILYVYIFISKIFRDNI